MTEGGGTVEIEDGTGLSRILRAARARKGWSQQEAADAAGVSRRLVLTCSKVAGIPAPKCGASLPC